VPASGGRISAPNGYGVAMIWLTLVGCLIDRDAYETRKAFLRDDDGDGLSDYDGDCDDANQTVFPGAGESCNERDDDCDGTVDEGEDLLDANWYADTDEDGYGGGGALATCEPPDGFVDTPGDCDDGDPARHPDAAEACNGVDDDCDDETDEEGEVEPIEWYSDSDGDGFGAGAPELVCEDPGGAALADGDCDDADDGVNPGVEETCNGVDDDCNGVVDDAPAITWYLDRDEDGFGDDDATYLVCTPPPGYTRDGGDCDDLDVARNPGETEVCEDGVDADCDGAEQTCGLAADESVAADMSARYSVAGVESYVARTVASAGDLDGDGDDELLITRPGHDEFDGAIALVPGQPDLYLGDYDLDTAGVLLTGSGAFGYAASGGEDVDGDGVTDLLVSAIFDDRAYLFTDGAAVLRGGLDTGDADVVLVGPGSDASFGAAVSLLGDLDGDGLGDWIVGDYLYENTGAAFLYYGGGGEVALASSRDQAQAGQEVAGIGDIDGDGRPDFAVADNKISTTGESSFAAIYFGDSTRTAAGDLAQAPMLVEGSPDESTFAEIVPLGDVNRDGHADAAFSAPDREGGAVFVVLGTTTFPGATTIERLADATWSASGAGVRLGASISGPGDLDGDGYDEIATTTARGDASPGTLYVLNGNASFIGAWTESDAWCTIAGGTTEAEGDAIAGPLDVNNDGLPDLLLSAWDPTSAQGQAWIAYGGP
jgi:hypothetical protein